MLAVVFEKHKTTENSFDCDSVIVDLPEVRIRRAAG